jgi:hypothetical protein
VDKFKNAIMKINNAKEFSLINAELKKMYSELDIAGWINSDMGIDDLEVVKAISNHLKSKGVNNTYETNSDKYNPSVKYFKPDSFKILATPVAAPVTTTADATTDPWTKFPCVTGYTGAVKTKDSSGGIVYLINGVYYYGNGRKLLADKTMGNYTCNDAEFKTAAVGAAAKNTQTQKTTITVPPELDSVTKIQAFQQWLDDNHGDDKEGQGKGWASGYTGGKIEQGKNGGGYGTFGKRTKRAWENPTYKDGYLKSLQTSTTTAPATTAPGPDDDIPQQ